LAPLAEDIPVFTSLLLKVVIGRILPGLFLALLTGQISQAGLDTGTRGVEIVLKEPEVILRSLHDKSWAIVIGGNQYPDGDRNTPNLTFAVSDAKYVSENLEGLGFEVRTVTAQAPPLTRPFTTREASHDGSAFR
jgi:hypothetical protein